MFKFWGLYKWYFIIAFVISAGLTGYVYGYGAGKDKEHSASIKAVEAQKVASEKECKQAQQKQRTLTMACKMIFLTSMASLLLVSCSTLPASCPKPILPTIPQALLAPVGPDMQDQMESALNGSAITPQ